MRYFITTNASRSYSTGGFTFSDFEPVGQRGGSWLGVLAVADEAAASALASGVAAGQVPGVDEITFERFDLLKKKGTGNSTSSTVSQRNPSQRPPASANPAVNHTARTDPNSTGMITAVTLLTGEATPPHESLLEQPAVRRKRSGK
jgi:hypothetical protein